MKKITCFGIFSILAIGIAAPAIAENKRIQIDYLRYNTAGIESVGPREPIVSDPKRKALPKDFAFPIQTSVAQNTSITTNTPITDAFGDNLRSWEEAIRECLQQKPKLINDWTGNTVLIEGQEGSIVLNSSGVSVCSP